MEEARAPDSDTDWQAIDIFVFSNGQQYSPPRKYHLQAEDIHLWKSTLGFLAKSQYGPYHSTIDLYTIEGTRVATPLQLSNGGSYVAVQPPDAFIEAGYNKYLIKASRSWEKRRAKRNEITPISDDLQNADNRKYVDEAVECGTVESEAIDERVILKSVLQRASSVANEDASTIIKPQLLPAPQRRSDSLFAARQAEKKRFCTPPPVIAKKITPSLLPSPNTRSSMPRKRDSIKSNQNVKISKPEERYTVNKQSPKLSKVIRPSPKPRELSVRPEATLPKVKAINEIKTLPSVKLNTTKNDEKVSTNIVDLKNIIDNKELIMVSNYDPSLYSQMPSVSINPVLQYPFKSNHSISVNPIQSVVLPVREIATTTIAENSEEDVYRKKSDMKISVPDNNENIENLEVLESINIDHNMTKSNARESISIEKLKIEQYSDPNFVPIVDENINLRTTINAKNSKVNIETLGFPPRRRSIKVELPFAQDNANYVANKSEENLNDTGNNKEALNIYKSSPPMPTSFTRKVSESQYIEQKIKETHVNSDLPPTVIDKVLNDQYKATLKKGDTVNVKLNIEIENQDGSLTKHNHNLNCQSVTIMQNDKGSQSNINNQIIDENKSLLSLIAKDLSTGGIGDNQHTIIVQYNCCKYCNEYNAAKLDQQANKKYVILMPIGKFEEMERCHCNETSIQKLELMLERCNCNESPIKKVEETKKCLCNETITEVQRSSIISPPKPTYSCTSLQRISNLQERQADIRSTSDTRSNENLVRRKSVAINEGSSPNTRVPSKTIQEIDVKMQLITVSVESVGVGSRITMKDNCTQTDWCDVLLQAQLLSDGHYTLHLPPLELLKFYKLT